MSKYQWWPRRPRPSDVAWFLGTGRRRASARGRDRFRPAALVLEDRRLLSGVINVTNTADSGDGSLRQAVAEAEMATSPVTIEFKLATPATITLTSGPLELSNSNTAVPIINDGPGAGELTIDGGQKGRVVQLDPNVSATVSDLTITGGGVSNLGTLALDRVAISGNAAAYGSGLYNTGTATLTECTISGTGQLYEWGGSVRNNGLEASMSLVDCTVTGNLNAATIFNTNGLLTVTGTTFRGNYSYTIVDNTGLDTGYGGGGGVATLTGCTIADNLRGTGVLSTDGQLTVANSLIYGNAQGLAAADGGTVTMTGTTVSGNREFGGLDLMVPSTVDNCTISDNFGSNYGGGVHGGPLVMSDCTISGNTASLGGGGIYLSRASTLTNCTIEGNVVAGHNGPYPARGGGVFNEGTDQLIGCTVTGNSATQGGGIYNYTYPGNTYTLGLTDTIVAGNTDGNGAASDINGGDAADVTGSYNLIGTGSSGGLVAADHNLLNVADPGLTPLGDYGGPTPTMALQPSSPARHGGTAVPGVTTDQRGFALDSPPDIGAFQSQPGPLVVDTAIDGLGSSPGQLSLRQAVNLADVLDGGATITFDRSAFPRGSAIALTAGQLELSNTTGPINILGPGLNELAISGSRTSRVFQVDQGASATLSGLTITGGVTTGNGGGLLNQGKVTLFGVAVVGNSAANGGGVANAGSAVILDSSIDGNAASADGGGIYNTGNLSLALDDLSSSSAGGEGGGLFDSGIAVLVFGTVDDNAASSGGGIYVDPSGSPAVLIGTEVKRNKGGDILGPVIRL